MLARCRAGWVGVLLGIAALVGCREDGTRSSDGEFLATPKKLAFGPTGLGTSKTVEVAITNQGRSPFEVLEATPTVPNVTVDGFAPFTLESGETRALAVRFRPEVEGQVTGALQIRTDTESAGEGGVSTHELSGVAVRGYVEVDRTSIDFGKVPLDTVTMQAITLHNPTTVDTDAKFSFEGLEADAFSSSSAAEGVTLEPGESRQVAVAFKPQKLGLSAGVLRVQVCEACEPVAVELYGTGVAQIVNVFPLSVDFGRVALGATAEETVTLVNDGNEPVTLERVGLDDATYALGSMPMMPMTLVPGQRISVQVFFAPKVTGPAKRGVLELAVSAENVVAGGYRIPVRGEGGSSCIQLNPRRLDFGVVPEGMSVTRRVDVLNRCFGSVQMSEQAVGATQGGFLSLAQASGMEEIPAGGMSSVKVTFTPKPGSGDTAGALRFKIFENGITHSEEVPVTGSTKVFAPCQYTLAPSQLDFGRVPVGAEVTLGIAIRNQGSEECVVSGFQLAVGSDAAFSATDVASALLQPGQKTVLQVRFKPGAVGSHAGMAEAYVSNPTSGNPRAMIKGEGVQGCFALQPTQVDFGLTQLSCGAKTRTITAYNNCTVPVTLSTAALDAPSSDEFTLQGGPSLPATLQPGTNTSWSVRYSPNDDGMDTAALRVDAGQGGLETAGLLGTGAVEAKKTDRFIQESSTKVDVLFVIDNSGSMMEEQQSLGQNFAAFLSAAQAQNIDYHIGVTTTGIETSPGGWSTCPGGVEGGEAGRLFPVDGSSPRIITPTTPNAAQVFAKNVQVGWCHWNEQGLDAAYRALSPPLVNGADDVNTVQPSDGNGGFLRPEAKLVLIFVTDEEDFSTQPVAFYETFFKALKSNDPTMLAISAIVGPANLATCPTASSSGLRYLELANATGGISESVCTANWASSLQNLSSNTFGPRRRFPLTQTPSDRSKLVVEVNGLPVTSGWTYDAASNTVVFDPANVPGPGAAVDVTYPLGC